MNFNTSNSLPETGFVRLSKKATPLLPAIIPVLKSTLFSGIHEDRYPEPARKFGHRISAYCVEDIRKLVESGGEVTP